MSKENPKTLELFVRGVSLMGFYEYLQSRLQEPELKRLIDQLPDKTREVVHHIKKWEWYPLEMDRHMREAIVRRFNPQNPRAAVFEASYFTAEYDINSFLRGIFSFLPIPMIIRQIKTVWSKFYKSGNVVTVPLQDGGVALELTEFEADYLFCPTIEAWLLGAMRTIGLKGAEVKETMCIHTGDDRCRWELRWKQ